MKATLRPTAAILWLAAACLAAPAHAQNYPVTEAQRATANQVAQAGVPLSELASGAPDRYTIQRGDTLWDISRLYLLRPWRWPELWGMNLDSIRNPHLIYPGQVLVLERRDGRATLRLAQDAGDRPVGTVRVSPRVRAQPLPDNALPTLQPHLIEPFLAEPLIVGEDTLLRAPRIVATTEERVLISRGDRAYARSGGCAVRLARDGPQRRFPRVPQCHAAAGPGHPRGPRLRGAVPGPRQPGARRRHATRRRWRGRTQDRAGARVAGCRVRSRRDARG